MSPRNTHLDSMPPESALRELARFLAGGPLDALDLSIFDARWLGPIRAAIEANDRDRVSSFYEALKPLHRNPDSVIDALVDADMTNGADCNLTAARFIDENPDCHPEAGFNAQLIRFADVRPESVHWLWPRFVPLAKLTVLDGDPGLGKSTVMLDIAARLSTGRTMPDGAPADLDGPAEVLLLSVEDGYADTIRPRLDAAGADLTRVSAPDLARERAISLTLADIERITSYIDEARAKLVVIDPLMAYLPMGVNGNVDQDVRRILTPITGVAARTGAAIVVIRHLRKSSAPSPMYRGGGSIGIIGAARSGLLVARDPSDSSHQRCVLAPTKSNLGKLGPSQVFRLEDTGEVARVVWEGVSQLSAADLLAQPDPADRTALQEAVDFLHTELAEGPVASSDLLAAAKKQGIAEKTLRRARKQACVEVTRSGFGRDGEWTWALPITSNNEPTT